MQWANSSNLLPISDFVVDTTDPALDINTGKGLNEGETGVIVSDSELSGRDNVSNADNITYTLVVAPSNGTLRKNTGALASAGTFTQN